MKVVVLVPSAESLATAGVRIRYLRLLEPLRERGVSLSVTPIDGFDPVKADCDVVIVSKCYEARALVASAVLRDRNIIVGIDLFDDYFSEQGDSRLNRYRNWLRQMLRLVHFTVCSTPAMAGVIHKIGFDGPLHILHDPAPEIDWSSLADLLQRKISRSKSSAVLRILWFGIGDNPFFPVGLSDVAAGGGALRELATDGLPVELTILTNKRALDAAGLAMIARLPIPAKVDLWSAQRESELLQQTDVCLLPVSAQPFSVSKSMNRALTALASGCQVLSLGYPLYRPLDELIYRETTSLRMDWRRGELRLRPASLTVLNERIQELASSNREAAALVEFLEHVMETALPPKRRGGPIALLHGFSTTQAAHAAVKAVGGLSIATPFCTQNFDFDAIIRLSSAGKPSLLLSVDALSRLKIAVPKGNEPAQRLRGTKFVRVSPDAADIGYDQADSASLPLRLALYRPVIAEASTLIGKCIGPTTLLLSEDSALPLEPAI